MPTLEEQVAALTVVNTTLTEAATVSVTAAQSAAATAQTAATAATAASSSASAKAAEADVSADAAAVSATSAAASLAGIGTAVEDAQAAAAIAQEAQALIDADITAAQTAATAAAGSATSAATSATAATAAASDTAVNAAAALLNAQNAAASAVASQTARTASETAATASATSATASAASATAAVTAENNAEAAATQSAASAAAAAEAAAEAIANAGSGGGGGGAGILPQDTYYYVITATSASGQSVASNERSVTTSGPASSNALSWSQVSGANGYKIYRGLAAGEENVFFAVGDVTTFVDFGASGTPGTPPSSNTGGLVAPVQNAITTASNTAAVSGLVPAVSASVFTYSAEGAAQFRPGESAYGEVVTGVAPNRVLTVTTQQMPTVRGISKQQADRYLQWNFAEFVDGSRWLSSVSPNFNNLCLYITQLAKAMKARLQDGILLRSTIDLIMPRGLWPFNDQAVLTEYVRLDCRGYMLRAADGSGNLTVSQRPLLAVVNKAHVREASLVCNAVGANPGSGVVFGKNWHPTGWTIVDGGSGYLVGEKVRFRPSENPYVPLTFTVSSVSGGAVTGLTLDAQTNNDGNLNHIGFGPGYIPIFDQDDETSDGAGVRLQITTVESDFAGDNSDYRCGISRVANLEVGTINTFGTANTPRASMNATTNSRLNPVNGNLAAVRINTKNLDIERLNIFSGYYGCRVTNGSDLRIDMINAVSCGWGLSVLGYSSAHVTQLITDSCNQGGLQLGSALGWRIGGRLFWEDSNDDIGSPSQSGHMVQIGLTGGISRNLDLDISLLNPGSVAGVPGVYVSRCESSTLNFKASNISYSGGTSKKLTALYEIGTGVSSSVNLLGSIDNITGSAVIYDTFVDGSGVTQNYTTNAYINVIDSAIRGVCGPNNVYTLWAFGSPTTGSLGTTYAQGRAGRGSTLLDQNTGDVWRNRGTRTAVVWVREFMVDANGNAFLAGNIGLGTAAATNANGPRLTASRNAAAIQALDDSITHVVGNNGQQPRMSVDAFGNSAYLFMRRANGTITTRTALIAGDTIGGQGAYGHGTTGYQASAGALYAFRAAENWSDTATGTRLDIELMRNGTITRRVVARFADNGDFDLRDGGTVRLTEGTNGRAGVATLINGVVTIANNKITATSRITLDRQTASGTLGHLSTEARTAGTGFTIRSSSATENSTVYFTINEPSV